MTPALFILTTHPLHGTKRSQFMGTREQAEAWVRAAAARYTQLRFEIVEG